MSLILCTPVMAENFYIENYDVNISVDKDKTAHVTEKIDTNFTASSHGIYRTIPLKGNSITNVHVSEHYMQNRANGNLELKIGDASEYVYGRHSYTISYDYNFYDNKNEFYFNIIGTQWPVEINHVDFTVNMPEAFNPDKAGLSIGAQGTAGFTSGAEFNINNQTITGSTSRTLAPYEGVTLRVEVPKGYFVKRTNGTTVFVILLMLLLCGVTALIWYVHGKDKIVVPVVNFYPPKNYNSAEVEMLYKGAATTDGLVSLIIYLANKGYLKIREDDFGYNIEQVKSYDGMNHTEKAFISALVPGGQSVSQMQLESSPYFYKSCKSIVERLNKARDKVFEPESIGLKLLIPMILCLLGLLGLTIFSLLGFDIFPILSQGSFLIIPIIAVLLFAREMQNQNSSLVEKLKTISIVFLIFAFTLIPIVNFLTFNSSTVPAIITGLICMTIAGICTNNLPKRSEFGNKMLGQLLGLKKFIEVAQKDKLEKLVKENPSYVYDVLPYAYILGVSDVWIKQFESIMTLKPDWYSGQRFNNNTFRHFTSSVHSASFPSTANGGISRTSSSGGGGFSGGGGGGGGGGSW